MSKHRGYKVYSNPKVDKDLFSKLEKLSMEELKDVLRLCNAMIIQNNIKEDTGCDVDLSETED